MSELITATYFINYRVFSEFYKLHIIAVLSIIYAHSCITNDRITNDMMMTLFDNFYVFIYHIMIYGIVYLN